MALYEVRFLYRIVGKVIEKIWYDVDNIPDENQTEIRQVKDGLHNVWIHKVVDIPIGTNVLEFVEDNLEKWAKAVEEKFYPGEVPIGDWKPNPKGIFLTIST